ncbi:DUF3971 domain-containing protein [Falsiroseomonas sp. CW058]|uniref:YhdP family protein n=1 Tax=Falsiroseomonas sp. CW058 TaxID=3388664 RepID=UPI003D31AF60
MARRAGSLLHLLLGAVTLALLALGVAGWRLAQGPVELPWLARQIEAAANGEAEGRARLEVGSAAIGWQGWRDGRLTPVDIRLSGVRLLDPAGAAQVALPDAALTLSLPWLLRGELAPRVLELRAPELRLRRTADGQVALMLAQGPPAGAPALEAPPGTATLEELAAELMRPPSEETARGALAALRITGGHVVVEDAALGLTWTLEETALELRRMPRGGISGRLSANLRAGPATVPIAGTLEAAGDPVELRFHVTLPEVAPARLAQAAPALAPLAGLDAPARIELAGRMGTDGVPRELRAVLSAGAGRLDLGGGRRIAILGGEAVVDHAPDRLRLDRAVLRLPGSAMATTLTATGEAVRAQAGWRGAATLELDAVPLAELPRHWPEGLGSGERWWITTNITAGEARNGRWRFEGEAAADLSSARLTGLSGTLDVADATVHWLRPVPPVERVNGQVAFSLAEVTARVASGRQAGTAVQARDTVLRFLFPDGQPPQAEMQVGLAGPVPDVLAVLQHPRLRLFERRPLPLKEPAGTLDGRLSLGFPLIEALQVEQLRIRAQARLGAVRLADVLFGRPLERGQFDLTVDNESLRVAGTAVLAEIPARLGVEMDFRNGPATQVVMRETVQARTDIRTLATLGLDAEDVAAGPVTLDVRTERRRGGAGRVNIRADLREATMGIAPLAWAKPAGQNAGADIVLRLAGDNLEAVEAFRVEAPGLSMRGNAAFARGARLERATISEAAVDGSRLAGEARPPPQPGAPWNVVLRGPVLDLRRALGEEGTAPAPAGAADAPPGAAYAIDGRFDRVLLGPLREIAAVEARVLIDGRGVVRDGRVAGRAGARGAFEASITPDGAGRAMRLTAEDAGALLGSFDVLRHLEGGRLGVQARYAHNGPGAPLSGSAEMSDFAVRNAPGFAKLLQAMTLYGLVEALSGPGLSFSRLVAPFTLSPDALVLGEARAFSASLGLTAKGTLDRRRQRLAMEGTIVPAYIFNSLLGNIPIFGRLFSPEAGGGLFAATFRIGGPVDDPVVNVNPLAALTPGFLRGLFGIGQAPPQQP